MCVKKADIHLYYFTKIPNCFYPILVIEVVHKQQEMC